MNKKKKKVIINKSTTIESNKEDFESDTEKNNSANNLENEQQDIKQETYYIGNKNTKKFHTLDCYNLPKLENQIEFESSEQAIKEGYSPCKNCNPK